MSEDIEGKAFVQGVFDCGKLLVAAILLWSQTQKLLSIIHHVPPQQFVVLVEVGFK